MKPEGCCKSCSISRLVYLIAGHVVAREVEVDYPSFLADIMSHLCKSKIDYIDDLFDTLRDNDTVTKMINGITVPGIHESIQKVFKNNLNTQRFCNAWKQFLKPDDFTLFTLDELEPYVKNFETDIDVSTEGLPEKVAVIAPVIPKRVYDFIQFARSKGIPVVIAEDAVLHNRKSRVWEIEFLHDIGRSFLTAPNDFFIWQAFYDDREHTRLFRSPNLAKIIDRLEVENVYEDCKPLHKILAVAEIMAKISTRGTFELDRCFENKPPVFGLLSRFPENLHILEKKTKSGFFVDAAHEGTMFYDGVGGFVINNVFNKRKPGVCDEKSHIVAFTRIAHSLIVDVTPTQSVSFLNEKCQLKKRACII